MKKKYFILAAIFLFNPVISIIDIFPDVFGYFLIFKALSEASYVYDNAYEAQMAFKRISIVSLAKLLCLFILTSTDATMALVLSFTFSILEFIYGIDAFIKLFDFMSYIALRCSEPSVAQKGEDMKKFTVVFFVIRIICSTVPDFFALFLSNPGKEWMYRFRNLMILIFTAFAVVVGVVWLVRAISFFSQMLTSSIQEKITLDFKEQMKDRQSVFFSKDFIFAISLISFALIFSIDFYIDKIEIFSDILLAPIVIACIMFLLKKGHIVVSRTEKLAFTTLLLHFVFSLINIIFLARFNAEHIIESVGREAGARLMYAPVVVFTVLENIVLVISVMLILQFVKNQAILKIKENPKFFSEYSVEGYLKDFTDKTKKKILISVIFVTAASVSSVIYAFICPYNDSYVALNTVIAIVSILPYVMCMSYVNDEIFRKILKYS